MRHMTEYSPDETGEYPRIFPNFQNCTHCKKDLKNNKHNSLHLARKYAWIFVLGHYLFLEAHSFPQATGVCSRKTVRFSEQIMSADKYPCIFSCQMEAIVYLSKLRLGHVMSVTNQQFRFIARNMIIFQ